MTMGLTAQKKIKKRNDLFDSAFSLFTTQGIDRTAISDITERAGVAKGTFYLYFKSKFDLRNRLIAKKSGEIFENAISALRKADIKGTEEKLLFVVDYIIDVLGKNKALLNFMAKNLSWGLFKNALLEGNDETSIDFEKVLAEFFDEAEVRYKNPELLLFMITEFVSGTCHSSILYSEPVSIEELKPHMHEAIIAIMHSQESPAGSPD